jgi:hypothetical protein
MTNIRCTNYSIHESVKTQKDQFLIFLIFNFDFWGKIEYKKNIDPNCMYDWRKKLYVFSGVAFLFFGGEFFLPKILYFVEYSPSSKRNGPKNEKKRKKKKVPCFYACLN